MRFIKNGTHLIAVDRIESADYSRIEELILTIHHNDVETSIEGADALEAAMLLNPACLEGKRLRWAKHKWLVHNLIGHPLMQLFAIFKCYRCAFWIHDKTVPMPRDRRS